MNLDFDQWLGNRNKINSLAIAANDAAIAILHLEMLNQKENTQLIIGGNKSNLMIGGGKGAYVCTVTIGDHEQYFNLVNHEHTDIDDEIEVVTGGQAGLFPAKIVANYTDTVAALTYYIRNQDMNPDLSWEEDV